MLHLLKRKKIRTVAQEKIDHTPRNRKVLNLFPNRIVKAYNFKKQNKNTESQTLDLRT